MPALKDHLTGFVLFAAVLAGTAWALLAIFNPAPYAGDLEFTGDYDPTPMRDALEPASVDSLRNELDALGPRLLGHKGLNEAAAFIEDFYAARGLEVYSLDGEVAAPVTSQREIRLAGGGAMPGVEVFPFPPNAFQPVITPPGGLTGKLVILDETTLLARSDFDDVIGVLRMDDIPRIQGLVWPRYAQMGMKGLIVVHPDGMEAMPWSTLLDQSGLQSILSINFPRLAATEQILDYIGDEVTLEVNARFQRTDHRTLVGVLRADTPKREALVFNVAYDQYGMLPDYGPNSLQTFPVATHLALVEGLARYQDQLERDIIFVATGSQYVGFAGQDHLLRMLGPVNGREAARRNIQNDIQREQAALDQTNRLMELVNSPGFLEQMDATIEAERQLAPPDRRFFIEELRHVINTMGFEFSENVLLKRIDFERGNTYDLDRPEYRAFLEAQFIYDDIAAAASLPLSRLFERMAIGVEPATRFTDAYDLRGLLEQRFEVLRRHHARQVRILEDGLTLNRLFSAYGELYVFGSAFLPKPEGVSQTTERISFLLAGPGELYPRATKLLASDVSSVIDTVLQRTGLSEHVRLQSPGNSSAAAIYRSNAHLPVPTSNWNAMGYRAFTLVNTDRLATYRTLSEPSILSLGSAETMRHSLALQAELALSMATGFGRIGMPPQIQPRQFSGRVYAADVGRSLIPNFPLANALIASKPEEGTIQSSPGRFELMHHFTDPHGRYSLLNASSRFIAGGQYNLQAVYYDPEGRISHIKDESASTQNLYRSMGMHSGQQNFRGINLVVFRAAPVAVLDLINPQTLRPFSAIRLIRAGSLTEFDKFNHLTTADGVTSFIPPDAYFYTTFRSGTPENELVQVVRSYMSGEAPANPDTAGEISGRGYLALDHTVLRNVPFEQARSMHRLNDTRLTLQEARGLADRHTLEFHQQAESLLETAADPEASPSFFQRMLTSRDSLTYSIIIHPILRTNINDAVISILWYMALLVPFMFFFEKLLFGFSDIRKQLTAQVVIFLIVFLLLRLLHPAFEMIRSSLMILLGFFILMISLAMTILFAGKFRENLDEIKQKRGQVTGADVNTMGVLGTAFMLGLNNMHRRKVRTGLTCMTLVLITFAMICFTSIYSDFEDSEVAVGRANYQGLLVKNEKFLPISGTERFAIESRYGFDFPVSPRSMYVGRTTPENERVNPELEISHQAADGRNYSQEFGSIIRFGQHEPLRNRLRLVSDPYWFEAADVLNEADAVPIIIPESMAERIGVRVEDVNAGGVPVRINGGDFIVRAIFDETEYQVMQDLDGRPILPFDIRGLREVERIPGGYLDVLGDEDGVLMAPSEIILAPHHVGLGITVANSHNRIVSLALDFESLSFREAREEIIRFLEQRARPAFYGVDGTGYRGSRMRVSSFAGLIDLIIPLIIAALTVLNTMKGSVYERRDEIYVYNAVGIAPKFIFFMFFAEAFVYAVVGCVLGYLLSQGTGTILTALDLTGGMNMTFASVNSIYASLAVVAAVFISTYFPARSAMEIAAPAEDAGWEMPEPEDDTYCFNLPFTFDRRERVAVLAFFHRFLADHGEGGAGIFSAGVPHYNINGFAGDGAEAVTPSIGATIWLKPYDLGVSQEMTIETPIDPETGDFIASIRLVRSSGTRESWQRVNRPFMTNIRKQFLHWRAVSPEMKAELYLEARQAIEAQFTSETTLHG